MEKVRWGLLSTARINRRLIPAIRASKRGELIAVASRDETQARDYARLWQIPKAFGSYQSMLDSGEVDAVYIGLPNHLHAEWSVRALEAGIHVLCEKPFAITLEQVDAMIDASRRSGKVLAEAFMYRHHSQTKILGELLASGMLGDIVMVRSAFNFTLDEPGNVRMVPEWGGGALWDVGVYPASFAQYVLACPPLRVSGEQWTGETGIDEVFTGNLLYPGDRLAVISCSFRSPFFNQAEVFGTQGRLVLERPFNGMDDGKAHMFFVPKDGKPQAVKVPKEELYRGEVEDMHAAILDGKPSYLTLEETRDHVRTVLALYESAKTGKTVSLAS